MSEAYYQVLLTEAAGFYTEHGTVDLVDLAIAAEMGVPADTFMRDVVSLSEALENERQ